MTALGRRRRGAAIGVLGLAAGLAVGACAISVDGTPVAAPDPPVRTVACDYQVAPNAFDSLPTTVPPSVPADQRDAYLRYMASLRAGASKQRSAPQPAPRQPETGRVTVTLTTSQGTIPITVEHTGAPCNAGAVLSLARSGYYDNTDCHRLTAAPALKVLQCGDPTGTGIGGPGWNSPDEFPTDLRPSGPPDPYTGLQAVTYPRGVVAVANSNSSGRTHTGDAQFFIVYGDSQIAANYAVIGSVDTAGRGVVDRVAAGGIAPDLPTETLQDGTPKVRLSITSATVS